MVITLGILNLSPDSFSDGDMSMLEPEQILKRVEQLIAAGVNCIDVGAVSTKPGAQAVSMEEELARLQPFFDALALTKSAEGGTPLKIKFSLDSHNSQVVRSVFKQYGEHFAFINDVTGLQNNNMISVISTCVKPNTRLVSMHSKGGVPPRLAAAEVPDEFYKHGLLEDLKFFWDRTISQMRRLDIDSSRLILDPGLGFGKNLKHSMEIIELIPAIKKEFGLPVLIGASRKSFLKLWKNSPEASLEELDKWTKEYNALAIQAGAELVRVHYGKMS